MLTTRDAGRTFRTVLILLGGAFPVLASCADTTQAVGPRPPALDAPTEPPPPEPPASPPELPALPRAGEIYVGPDDLYGFAAPYHGGRLVSRYVFYDDGKFSLQFSSLRFGDYEYLGWYARADAQIMFAFDWWSPAGSFDATGTLRGDLLSVRYNTLMMASDFVDGTYVRSPVAP